ncbi:MAG: molybdopterin molybdotransferase MoeA [Proteobacteria bacterium]|nr:molybdopterin molybdotransferase MoeA [Pseudomonadota bacterium]
MFFKVKTTEEVLRLLKEFHPVETEPIPLEGSLGRVVGEDILSPEDLPGFQRCSMDGYAIRAKDSFGASESLPALLEIVGEVKMGRVPTVTVREGQAVKISTGGMLPDGADGVVMVEYCHLLDEDTIEIARTISPQENVIQPDDDFKKGSVVLPKGSRLRPQDVGVLGGLGLTQMMAYKRPKVAIISTGDEVVPVDQPPKPGQVRDINSYTLSAFCQLRGVEPVIIGLCQDHFDQLRSMVEKGLAVADTVWISGGSSVGTRDLTLKVFESFADMEILVHGISISPGKPTVIARMGHRAIFGLPGHTASAMVVAEVFLGPFLSRLAGVKDSAKKGLGEVQATLSRNIESAGGRDDFIRVKLTKREEGWVAEPIFGKSGLISTLVEADGLLRVDRNTEGLYQGDQVKVMVFETGKGGFF